MHLDVPWTPARLAQRVGRAARPGAPHRCVRVHALAPPLGPAHWLRLGARLRGKAAAARDAIGGRSRTPGDGDGARHLRIAARLERWLDEADACPGTHEPDADPRQRTGRPARPGQMARRRPPLSSPPAPERVVAAVRGPCAGFLAVVRVGGVPHLVAGTRRGGATTDARAVARAVRWAARGDDASSAADTSPSASRARPTCSGPAASSRDDRRDDRHDDRHDDPLADLAHRLATAHRAIARWRRRALVRTAFADAPPSVHRSTARLAARADAILAAAPAHRRPLLAPSVALLRAALVRARPAGVERALAALPPTLPPDAWLAAAIALCTDARPAERATPSARAAATVARDRDRVLALILLVPPPA